ncbi:isochorismate synthase [Salinarchaeum sp. Harcht-Bsk1]|uniref:isochorismate synthase n=1 Tax=Salinarchaeum sp. Harcht-Bsk1 TaxID=1333523 RepID=UPI00034240ED|nr:isochorismate synthase [Salinarchaeum sp. Harcht-Bsk1]AGN02915.1 isochorismate synthase [Salinarchaeum sp. Harcht-Bsk1]
MDGSGAVSVVAGDGALVSHTRTIPDVALRAVLEAFGPPTVCWRTPDEPSLVGCGSAATLTATGADRFAEIRSQADDLFGSFEESTPRAARPRLFGGFAFHGDHEPGHPWTGFPGAYFVLPEILVVRDGEETRLTVTLTDVDEGAASERADEVAEQLERLPDPGPPASPPGFEHRRRDPSREQWNEQVLAAIDRIEDGSLRKVVLAQSTELSLSGPLSPSDALTRLAEPYPDCTRFALSPTAEATLFGATPERLVSLSGRSVETWALAGSTGRGDTEEEDEWLARELQKSQKDQHEHALVVDAIRDQLDPVAASVTTGQRRIRTLSTVQHLETPIAAELADAEHVLSIVEALHPTPAVGGLPPEAALETIRSTETFDRGWYAAPVGWFDAAGDGTFEVAIRSAVANGSSASLFAGAGIVADSEPDREWDEVQLKYGPMLEALSE